MGKQSDDGLSRREREVVEMVADMFGGELTVENQQEAAMQSQKMQQRLVDSKSTGVMQSYAQGRQQMTQNFNSIVMQEERSKMMQRQNESRQIQNNVKAKLRGETPVQQDRTKPDGYDALMAQIAFEAMSNGPQMGD